MPEQHSCISVLPDDADAAAIIQCLQQSKALIDRISIVGDSGGLHNGAAVIAFSHNRIQYRGEHANRWQAIWRLLPQAAAVWLPSSSLLLAAGPVVKRLLQTDKPPRLHSEPDPLVRALFALGAPVESIRQYQQTLAAQNSLLIVEGERRHVEAACEQLSPTSQQVTIHAA